MATVQKHPVERRAFQIDDVDITTRTAHVVDKLGGQVMVNFRYLGSSFQIPAPGEVWICERNTGNEWHLFRRRDKNAEHEDLQAMVPGDTRITAPKTIRHRAQGLEVNGLPYGATRWDKHTTSGSETTMTLSRTPISMQTVALFNNGALVDPSGITLDGKVLTFPSIATAHILIAYYQTVES